MLAPAPVIRRDNGYTLDAKFIEGMKLHAAHWVGDIACVLREGATEIPFGARDVTGIDGVALHVLGLDEPLPEDLLKDCDVVFCGADDQRNLDLPARAQAAGAKIAFTIEYTFQTRLQMVWNERARSLPKRLYSMLWLARQERRLRRAIRQADGLQSNGYPAHALYGPMATDAMLYLDNRLTPDLQVTEHERAARAARLRAGAPLRLVFSGRLEAIKGAHDLVPVAGLLKERGLDFSLDIFGAGSLRDEIATGIARGGLEGHVTLHEAVDFETELVPWLRAHADIYLCCHRQSDPSCTYLETMGCGLAVAGFGNGMWSALREASQAGWVVPMGDRAGMVDTLARLDREDIVGCCERAAAFARAHDFQTEFRKRMDHLAVLAGDV